MWNVRVFVYMSDVGVDVGVIFFKRNLIVFLFLDFWRININLIMKINSFRFLVIIFFNLYIDKKGLKFFIIIIFFY